ncbi:unnamed protein product [Ilex paraguariensis]|uniref:Homoserine kinase n=1 Tax=Ilex paraguariensis TaxID=185542 RepID=A0ABC8RRF9_9AQUA
MEDSETKGGRGMEEGYTKKGTQGSARANRVMLSDVNGTGRSKVAGNAHRYKCNLSPPSFQTLATEPEPVFTSVKAFAPATVANLGPGFDFLGCAVDGIGDFISLRVESQVHPGEISISEITGADNSTTKLSKNPLWDCAGISPFPP